MWNSCNQGNQWWCSRLMIEGSGLCTLIDVTDSGWICRTIDSVDPPGKCWDRWIRRSIYWSDLRRVSSSLPLPSFSLLKFFFRSALLFGFSFVMIRSQWDACLSVTQSTLALRQFLLKDWKPVFMNVDAYGPFLHLLNRHWTDFVHREVSNLCHLSQWH